MRDSQLGAWRVFALGGLIAIIDYLTMLTDRFNCSEPSLKSENSRSSVIVSLRPDTHELVSRRPRPVTLLCACVTRPSPSELDLDKRETVVARKRLMLRYSSWKPKQPACFAKRYSRRSRYSKIYRRPREPLGHVPEPPRMIVYLILTVWPRERPPEAVRAAAVEVAHELPVHHVRPVLARVAAEAPVVPGAPPRGAI